MTSTSSNQKETRTTVEEEGRAEGILADRGGFASQRS